MKVLHHCLFPYSDLKLYSYEPFTVKHPLDNQSYQSRCQGETKPTSLTKIKLSSKLQLIKAEAWENVKHINKSVTVKSAKNLLSEYTVKGKKQDVFAVSVFGFISRLFVGKKTLKCH